MLVKKYKSRVVSILNPFKGIYTLEFKSLNGNFKYHPGQFLHLAIDTDYDGSGQWPESRCFSMQSNPGESNIRITYSVKGKFTKLMENYLKMGSEVWLKLPYGDLFSQEHSKVNTAFIAGGTGITPYLSLFTFKDFIQYKNPILYAGFGHRSLNLYSEQLEEAISINKCFRIFLYYQDKDGILDIGAILTNSDLKTSFFISGPPFMIKEFKKYLLANNINENQIRTDNWE